MNIILFGPPGAGKGTQGTLLADRHGLVRLSTGDLLRDAMRDGTQLGLEARRFVDAGELVPDDVILGMVRQVMAEAEDASGFIFDGFPRTTAQAEGLSRLLAEMSQRIDAVVVLDVDDETIVGRLSARLWCSQCGAVYNLTTHAPNVPGVCGVCGGELVQRADDREETVRRRLEVYRSQTAPVVAWYRREGVPVREIDGNRAIEEVQREVEDQVCT